MSNRNHPADSEDRLEFLIALMTKDYTKAMAIGSEVLRRNPSDMVILKTLSIIKDKIAVNSLAESGGDDSDEDTDDEENMQTDCETSSDLDFDTDDDDDEDETESENDDQITIDPNKCCQSDGGVSGKNFSDYIKECLRSPTDKEDAVLDYKFKKKIYRILMLNPGRGMNESIPRT